LTGACLLAGSHSLHKLKFLEGETLTKEELYTISFQLILHSGNARSLAMEAIFDAKEKSFASAAEKLSEAGKELNEAHHYQTQLIQAEAGGESLDLPIILVHAQDHLMTAMTVKDLAAEIIEIRQEMISNLTGEESE
jgi:PTS system cellobiose-specific IIA component